MDAPAMRVLLAAVLQPALVAGCVARGAAGWIRSRTAAVDFTRWHVVVDTVHGACSSASPSES